MIVDTSHPDIWFSLAREDTHVSKTFHAEKRSCQRRPEERSPYSAL
jgi:hypothetical protein